MQEDFNRGGIQILWLTFLKKANNQAHVFHSNESWQIFLRSKLIYCLCTQTQVFHQTGKNILTEFYMALFVKKEQITRYLSIQLEPPRLHPICTNAAPTLHQRCTNAAPTLHQCCTNAAPTLHQRCTNAAPTLHQRCKDINIVLLFNVYPETALSYTNLCINNS